MADVFHLPQCSAKWTLVLASSQHSRYMQHVLRAKSRQRRPRTPGSSVSPKSSRSKAETEGAAPLRLPALYCTPHIKVPGTLFVSPLLVTFTADSEDKHVKEFGGELYQVNLEVQDVLQCGGITMPHEDGTDLAYFLQLQTRTLNGHYFTREEDGNDPWFVVFRLMGKEDLHRATALLLDAKQASPSQCTPTTTSVPFPCLDCMAELEHAIHHHQLQQQLAKKQERWPSSFAPSRLNMGSFAKFLSGPGDSRGKGSDSHDPAGENAPDEPRGVYIDKVVFQLPEHCQRSVLTKDLAEALLEYLPVGLRLPGLVQWVLRYTPKAHGVSLATMFRNLAEVHFSSTRVHRCSVHRTIFLVALQLLLGNLAPGFMVQGRPLSSPLERSKMMHLPRFNSSHGLRSTSAACMRISRCSEWAAVKDDMRSLSSQICCKDTPLLHQRSGTQSWPQMKSLWCAILKCGL